jgi:hypothetical protein
MLSAAIAEVLTDMDAEIAALEQRLVKTRLELARYNHESVVISLETVFDGFSRFQLIERTLCEGFVRFRVNEIRESIKDLVVRLAFTEFVFQDLIVPKTGKSGCCDNHCLGFVGNQLFHLFVKDTEHNLRFVLNEFFILVCKILQHPYNNTLRVEPLFLRSRNKRAV